MARAISLISFLISCLLLLTLVQANHPVVRRRSRARAFIELQCQKTLYTDLCIRSLSYYVNNFTKTLSQQKLAQIALKVSLAKAQSTQIYVKEVVKELNRTKGKDYLAIKDCLDQINDGVEQLSNCISEASNIKENGESRDFPWHASNVKTWMSAALTDASFCIDGFSGRALGGRTKAMIKARVLNLEQATSNALSLFNRFAARYKSSHAIQP